MHAHLPGPRVEDIPAMPGRVHPAIHHPAARALPPGDVLARVAELVARALEARREAAPVRRHVRQRAQVVRNVVVVPPRNLPQVRAQRHRARPVRRAHPVRQVHQLALVVGQHRPLWRGALARLGRHFVAAAADWMRVR